jgi:hypothetical protein
MTPFACDSAPYPGIVEAKGQRQRISRQSKRLALESNRGEIDVSRTLIAPPSGGEPRGRIQSAVALEAGALCAVAVLHHGAAATTAER